MKASGGRTMTSMATATAMVMALPAIGGGGGVYVEGE